MHSHTPPTDQIKRALDLGDIEQARLLSEEDKNIAAIQEWLKLQIHNGNIDWRGHARNNINPVALSKYTLVHLAAEFDSLKELKTINRDYFEFFVQTLDMAANSSDDKVATPIATAVRTDNIEMVAWFLRHHRQAVIDWRDPVSEGNIIHLAATQDVEILALLEQQVPEFFATAMNTRDNENALPIDGTTSDLIGYRYQFHLMLPHIRDFNSWIDSYFAGKLLERGSGRSIYHPTLIRMIRDKMTAPFCQLLVKKLSTETYPDFDDCNMATILLFQLMEASVVAFIDLDDENSVSPLKAAIMAKEEKDFREMFRYYVRNGANVAMSAEHYSFEALLASRICLETTLQYLPNLYTVFSDDNKYDVPFLIIAADKTCYHGIDIAMQRNECTYTAHEIYVLMRHFCRDIDSKITDKKVFMKMLNRLFTYMPTFESSTLKNKSLALYRACRKLASDFAGMHYPIFNSARADLPHRLQASILAESHPDVFPMTEWLNAYFLAVYNTSNEATLPWYRFIARMHDVAFAPEDSAAEIDRAIAKKVYQDSITYVAEFLTQKIVARLKKTSFGLGNEFALELFDLIFDFLRSNRAALAHDMTLLLQAINTGSSSNLYHSRNIVADIEAACRSARHPMFLAKEDIVAILNNRFFAPEVAPEAEAESKKRKNTGDDKSRTVKSNTLFAKEDKDNAASSTSTPNPRRRGKSV